jgi:transposase
MSWIPGGAVGPGPGALGGGSGRKTDEADNYAVAVAGLRGHGLQVVKPEDEVAVLKMLTDRRQQLVGQRIAVVNRLHDVLQDLLPGGASTRLTATKAHQILAAVSLSDPVGQARKQRSPSNTPTTSPNWT